MLSIHNQIEAHMMHQMIKEMARMKVLKLTFRMFTVRAKSCLRDNITSV